MKKTTLVLLCVVLMAAGAAAADKPSETTGAYELGTPFEADLGLGYRWNISKGNPLAGEYEYQHSSPAGKAIIEWDPLPQRFLLETYIENSKDYFGEFDYAYRDVVMLTMSSRSLYQNLGHYSLGQDDPSTSSPSMVDFNPFDVYGMQDAMNRAQVRFKAPDFPFHIYLEAKNQEKHGTIQQVFLRSFSGGFNKASQSRSIDWETTEWKATANSHLGPVEVEVSHAEKNFKDTREKVLTDTTSVSYAHNLIPKLESSVDTIKVHTSLTGRVAASATYSAGDRKNMDSNATADTTNAAADITYIPTKDLTLAVKYRHYSVDEDNPATVNSITAANPTAPTALPVKDALSYTRDIVSGTARYRATQNLVLRGEVAWEDLSRDNAALYGLDDSITRTALRLGLTYRITNRMLFRGDIGYLTADVPAGSTDNTYPDSAASARGIITWTPASWFNTLLSGSVVHEERSDMGMPFTGTRKTDRSRILGSMTFLAGKKTAMTPSYSFIQNKSDQPLAYTDAASAVLVEGGVPYADTSHIFSLSVTHAVTDMMTLAADAGRSWSRGSWENSGAVPGSSGIPVYSDIHIVETFVGCDMHVQYTKLMGSDFRYQFRRLNDVVDNGQDGTNQILLATLTYTW
jgi:hypothetical protein